MALSPFGSVPAYFDDLHESDASPSGDYYHHSAFTPLIGRRFSDISEDPVFPLIHRVRQEVSTVIDTALTYEQLKSPTINFSLVRPLTTKLSRGARPPSAILYALLVNRVQFLAEADDDLAYNGVNTARADLCELLAIKMLSAFGTAPASLELLHVLTTSFSPLKGAQQEMFAAGTGNENLEDLKLWGERQSASALELGVFSGAKRFVRSPLVQQVVSGIYEGKITFLSHGGAHALLSDDWKARPTVEIYDWRQQPFLDHYRLRVPAIRHRLEFCTFCIILVLFLLTQTTRSPAHVNAWEVFFILWSLGFALDELSSIKENGMTAYLGGANNALDATFCTIFFAFLALRVSGLMSGDEDRSELAFDTLALAGCVLLPRLSISLIRGNIVLLALGVLVQEFLAFMLLASLTASGFLVALWVLGRGTWGIGRISWMMLKIWLGNSYVGFDSSLEFHPVYGPFLIVVFAILSQTLLLTILISLLSNSFAAVQANAQTEILHQNALRTIERVKSDALTSYMPPLNLLAFSILFLVKPFLSPRYFHKLNVLLIKIFNLPVLLCIAIGTRLHYLHHPAASRISLTTQRALASLPTGLTWTGTADGLSKVFELDLTDFAVQVDSMDNATPEDEEPQVLPASPTSPASASGPRMRLGVLGGGNHHTKMPISRNTSTRIGSLVSPLARMFSMGPAVDTRPPAAAGNAERSPLIGDVQLYGRLDGIEASLAALVRELSDKSSVAKPSMSSLTGATEESYGKDD